MRVHGVCPFASAHPTLEVSALASSCLARVTLLLLPGVGLEPCLGSRLAGSHVEPPQAEPIRAVPSTTGRAAPAGCDAHQPDPELVRDPEGEGAAGPKEVVKTLAKAGAPGRTRTGDLLMTKAWRQATWGHGTI